MLGEYEIQLTLLLFPKRVLHNQRHEMEKQIQHLHYHMHPMKQDFPIPA